MARKKEKTRHAGGIVFGNIFAFCASVFIGFWAATQKFAAAFLYQPDLGKPLFTAFGVSVYQPFAFLQWLLNFNHVAGHELNIGIAIITASVFIGLLGMVIAAVWRTRGVIVTTTYGSAKWAADDEIRAAGILGGKDGVVLGKTKSGEYLIDNGDQHVKVIAPTGSGKTVGLAIPTLLNWHGSVIVNDIKGELWEHTSGWRSKFSYCIAFNPSSRSTARFNPLLEVRRGDNEVRDVQNIVEMLTNPDGTAKEDHWTKEASAYLLGVILHVLYTRENKSLEGVYYFLNDPSKELDDLLNEMLQTEHYGVGAGSHQVITARARAMLNKSKNEKTSVHSSAAGYLSLFADPVVAAATSESDFRIDDLQRGKNRVSLYCIIPPGDLNRLRRLYRLVFNQIMSRLSEEHDTAKDNFKVLFLLDEFPSLGKLPIFEVALGYMRSYGVKAMLISQDYTQLIAHYGANNSIVSSCHIRVYFAPNEIATAEKLSKELGNTTIVNQQKNYGGNRLNPWLGHVMISNQEVARPLLTAAELKELPRNDSIILVTGFSPIYCKKIQYYSDPKFASKFKGEFKELPITADRPYPFGRKIPKSEWFELPPVIIWQVNVAKTTESKPQENSISEPGISPQLADGAIPEENKDGGMDMGHSAPPDENSEEEKKKAAERAITIATMENDLGGEVF